MPLQQRADALHHPPAVIDPVSPGGKQVPHRLLLLAGDPDRGQQPGPVQQRQADAVRRSARCAAEWESQFIIGKS